MNASGKESFGEMTNEIDTEFSVHETDTGYTVQLAIPWVTIEPEPGQEIGFDLQINDANSGNRESIALWNDLTGQGYQNTSVFGELELVGEDVSNIESDIDSGENEKPISTWLIGGVTANLVLVGIFSVIKQKK